MRLAMVGLAAFGAVLFSVSGGASALAEDRIDVQMRVEGTILKPDDLFRPFKTQTPVATIGSPIRGVIGGDEFCVLVTKDKLPAHIWLSCGGDKKLQEQVAKLAGQRLVVECKGEYKLHPRTVEYELNRVRYKTEVVDASPVLTVTKIEPAK